MFRACRSCIPWGGSFSTPDTYGLEKVLFILLDRPGLKTLGKTFPSDYEGLLLNAFPAQNVHLSLP